MTMKEPKGAMKLTVAIYVINEQGEDEHAGDLIWDGKKITASDPDRHLLKSIMTTPLEWRGLKKPIEPRQEPELFMRSLWKAYRGAYLRALKATTGDCGLPSG
jgi:hypothetical protein